MNETQKEMQPAMFIRRCAECIHIGAIPMENSYTYKCTHPVLAAKPWTTPRRVDPSTIPAWCPLPTTQRRKR